MQFICGYTYSTNPHKRLVSNNLFLGHYLLHDFYPHELVLLRMCVVSLWFCGNEWQHTVAS